MPDNAEKLNPSHYDREWDEVLHKNDMSAAVIFVNFVSNVKLSMYEVRYLHQILGVS